MTKAAAYPDPQGMADKAENQNKAIGNPCVDAVHIPLGYECTGLTSTIVPRKEPNIMSNRGRKPEQTERNSSC